MIALITLTVVGSILGLRLPNERYAVNFSKFPSTNNVQAPPPENKTESQYIGERVPNCKWLFLGKTSERKFTEEYMKNHTKQHPSVKEIVKKSNNCSSLISLGYLVKRHTLIEHDFPIAFAIHVRKNIVQTERLLRMIYRPQNMYCIHLNGSVAPEQYHAAKAISKCFSNVFVVKDFQTHANDHFARVQGELNCMKFIANQGQDWKYYLNIDDSSLPLKTNWEMINILGVYDGANDFEGTSRNDSIPWKSMRVIERKNNTFVLTNKVKGPPPHGIKNLVRGKEYGIFSWEFVKFILNDKRAKDFIEWSKDTVEPEKYLWTSLHHTCYHPGLKTPGGYSGNYYCFTL